MADYTSADKNTVASVKIKVEVDSSELDSALEKAERLEKLLKKSKRLICELHHKPVKVTISAKELAEETAKMIEHDKLTRGVKYHRPDYKEC